MRVRMTPHEYAVLSSGLALDESGMIVFDVPDHAIDREAPRLVIANPFLVRYGDRVARLTSTQHALVRFVLAHGTSDFEAVKSAVWLKPELADSTIRGECSRTSRRLLDAGIPFELSAANGYVAINSI